MKVFKRDGSDQWCGKIRVSPGKWRTVYLFTDKAASNEALWRQQKDADQRRAGLLTTATDAAALPLAEHMADFLDDSRRQGFADKHLYLLRTSLDRLMAMGDWKRLADLTPDAMQKILARLADGGTGPATCNKYLVRAKTFCNWCVKHDRLPANPLASVAKARETPAQRQALSDQQVAALLATAPTADVYRMALLTGLRRGELRQLQWGDLRLDAVRPFIQLQGQTTKNRRADVLPLHADLVAMLKAAMPGHPKTKVFAAIPGMKRFRKDLKRAGIPAGDFDFHCLRHTFCTMVVRSGCSMKEAQQLMRHRTIDLTAKVYTHLGITDIAGALDKVRIPTGGETQNLRATGTVDTRPLPQAETGCCGEFTPPSGLQVNPSTPRLSGDVSNGLASAHQMAHQNTCILVHGGAQEYTSTSAEVKTTDPQETPANTRDCATVHDDTRIAGDGTRTHNSQLGRLALCH